MKIDSPTSTDFTDALFLVNNLLWSLGATVLGPGLVNDDGFLDGGPVITHRLPVVYDGLVVDGADGGILPPIGDSVVYHIVLPNHVFSRLDVALKT